MIRPIFDVRKGVASHRADSDVATQVWESHKKYVPCECQSCCACYCGSRRQKRLRGSVPRGRGIWLRGWELGHPRPHYHWVVRLANDVSCGCRIGATKNVSQILKNFLGLGRIQFRIGHRRRSISGIAVRIVGPRKRSHCHLQRTATISSREPSSTMFLRLVASCCSPVCASWVLYLAMIAGSASRSGWRAHKV
jgi:hypothetical protein